MRLAGLMGLNVPQVWRLYVPEPVFIIERFDRRRVADAPELQRVHALDGCQVLNESAIFKYQSATFPNLQVLIGLCRNKALARMRVFQWILFNTLVGNSDCHLKNISFLVDGEGQRVAPFYDLLCTAVYHTRALADESAVWPNEPLAMPVMGAGRFGEVTYASLIATGEKLGLAAKTAAREVARMMHGLGPAADRLIAQMEAEYAAGGAMGEAEDATRGAEMRLLRAIRHVVIQDMLARVQAA